MSSPQRIVEESQFARSARPRVSAHCAITTTEFRAMQHGDRHMVRSHRARSCTGELGMTFQWPLGMRKTLMRHAEWL
jgi:hypothetical protein